jgi:hypothetical protein
MIETDGAVLKVSASYAVTKPGAVPYSSENAHYSFSVEQPVEDGVSLDDLVGSARDLSAALTTGVKLMVFTELDVAFEEADGTLRPVLTVAEVPTAAPAKSYAKPAGRPASGNTGTQTSQRATINADLGNGMRGYLDNRGLKQSGEFKAGAADFRSVDKIDGRYHSVWIAQKDGTPNAEVVEALQGAGISV